MCLKSQTVPAILSMNRYKVYQLICFGVILFCAACTHSPNSRLVYIQELSDSIPAVALDSLRSINPSSLPVDDRYLYDFLSVKLTDKTYGTHHSDSLINRVIDYAADNWDEALYAEALYYGGRVNADLFSYPEALQYFEEALDAIPQSNECLELKSRILSQTGRLLNTLRLYNEAIPFIESTIEIDSILKDTVNTVYDLQLLGSALLHAKEYTKAELRFTSALNYGKNLSQEINAKSRMYLAGIKHKTGNTDSALILIRDVPRLINKKSRNTAIAYAANIYYESNMLDSAYLYAYSLIHSDNYNNKQTGYEIILSPELRQRFSTDSILKYTMDYRYIIERIYDENDNLLSVIQQAAYNYEIHVRQRAIAEHRADTLLYWVIASLLVIFFLISAILIRKNRHNKTIIQLQRARQYILQLESGKKTNVSESNIGNPALMRQQLREDILNIYNSRGSDIPVDVNIIQSDSYQKLQSLIAQNAELKDESSLWSGLEDTLNTCSPNFLSTIQLLADGKLTRTDIRTAILIKFGISPSHMAILINRAKGTVSYRREILSKKLFDETIGLKDIDNIIRLI